MRGGRSGEDAGARGGTPAEWQRSARLGLSPRARPRALLGAAGLPLKKKPTPLFHSLIVHVITVIELGEDALSEEGDSTLAHAGPRESHTMVHNVVRNIP